MCMELGVTMKLGQGHYQVTQIEMKGNVLDVTLTCSNVQEIHLELNATEAQTLVNTIYNTVDNWRSSR